jgi:aspartyl-tRNA synthetase
VKAPPSPNAYRDTWAGEVTAEQAGSRVRVAGWVHRRRDHGGLVFIDLRDRSGIVQLVFHPEHAVAHEAAHRLRPEHVLSAAGQVARRDPENVNPSLATGEIEIEVSDVDVLAEAQTPPFPIDEDTQVDELVRMRHRYLDLRRERPRESLLLRHRITQAMRHTLDELDFAEIETPMLTRSTPEGARDFLVPSRVNPGSFYALPQSPQLFKQLLMIGGFERYFQIVRCFRDEDPRADRQPEFTQLDLEMSFVAEDDVMAVMERVMTRVFEVSEFDAPPAPWPRMPFDEAAARFGSDRPDTRFGMEIVDVSEALRGSEFKVFQGALDGGGVVRAINAGADGAALSRSELEGLNEIVRRHGARAVAPMPVGEGGEWGSNLARFFTAEQQRAVTEVLGAEAGDLLLFAADSAGVASAALGALRLELAERFELIPDGVHAPVWIVDFPMFEQRDGRWDPLHHPFTAPAPAPGETELSLADPGSWRSRGYDLVLDGFEIGGGSIRISNPELQEKVLELIGIDREQAQARFGFLLDALRYGAPPHGGIAMGLDRIVAMMAGWRTVREVNIREVITFPKTATGADPLTGAPAPVDQTQLRELGLRVLPRQ